MSQWYALRCATRRERAAHDALTEKGFAVFLPMETLLRRLGRQFEVYERPLFPSYLFVLGQDADFPAMRTAHTAINGFVQINTPRGPAPMAIPVRAILGLQAEERAGTYNRIPKAKKPAPYAPKAGVRVQITTGVWQGYFARVLQTPRGQRANVLIQLPDGGTKGKDFDVKDLKEAA